MRPSWCANLQHHGAICRLIHFLNPASSQNRGTFIQHLRNFCRAQCHNSSPISACAQGEWSRLSMNEEPTGRPKTLDFSPAQPWRAARLSSPKSETRLIPRKAAASEEANRTSSRTLSLCAMRERCWRDVSTTCRAFLPHETNLSHLSSVEGKCCSSVLYDSLGKHASRHHNTRGIAIASMRRQTVGHASARLERGVGTVRRFQP